VCAIVLVCVRRLVGVLAESSETSVKKKKEQKVVAIVRAGNERSTNRLLKDVERSLNAGAGPT